MTKAMSLILTLVAAMALSGCALVSDGGDGSSSARVTQAVMTSQVNEQGQAVAPARVFAPSTQRIFAVLNLEGVKEGVEISGKWYQTSTQDVPPEGSEVHSSTIKLDSNTVSDEGRSRVALFLPGTTQGIPEDSWVLRVYAGDRLIRTMAFVVAGSGGAAAPAAPTQAPSQPAAATATPAFRSYTVVSGDTLQSIAQRFKPATEDVNAFTGRIRTANNLTSDNLNIGQVLRIPN